METQLNTTTDTVPPSTLTPSALGNPPQPAPPVKTAMNPKPWIIVAIVVLAIIVVGLGTYFLLRPRGITSAIRPYFTYEQADINALKALSSNDVMSTNEAQIWQDKAYELVEDTGTVDVDSSKVYAYLSVAQMDAAALSFKAHQSFSGSLATVSKDVLCELYASSCTSLVVTNEDAYSKKLADIVLAKVRSRIAADNAQTKPLVLKTEAQYWQGPPPQIGLSAPSFKPWFITSAEQFRVPPPLDIQSAEMQQELETVKQTLANATNEEKAIVVKWAGGPGTRTPPGIWLTLADDYMKANNTPFDTRLEVQALLAMSMADAVIGVFDSKYTHQYKRPNMLDTSIVTIMPTPNHPSYPAGHATISWAAAVALSNYLPENKQEWERLADEASNSRTIGGIHFPADNEAGQALGVDIGNEAIKRWQE